MKLFKIPLSRSLLLLVFVVLTATGCDFQEAKDAFDQFDVIIELEEVKTSATVSILDAQTGSFVEETVTFTFRGDHAGEVVDMFADPVDEMTIEGGIGTIGIANSITPTGSSPVSVRVIASAPGYQPGSVSLKISTAGQSTASVQLTRQGQAVSGSSTASSGGSTSGGTSQQPIQAQTPPSGSTSQTATVTVPQGTQMQTSTGATASGNVNLNVSYYPQANQQTAAAFSGGMSTTVQSRGGSQQQTAIAAGSFVSISMTDDQGNELTQFNPAIEISLDINPGTINPATGAAYQAGESVDILSYLEDEGVWVVEGAASLEGPNSQGNLYALFSTNHLSDWVAGSTEACPVTFAMSDRNGWTGPIQILVAATDGSFYDSVTLPAGVLEVFLNVPTGKSFNVDFVVGGTIVDSLVLSDACGQSPIFHTLPAPPPTLLDVSFSVDLGPACEALRITSVNAFTVSYRKTSQSDNQAGTIQVTNSDLTHDDLGRINGGSVVVPNLEQGETYVFFSTFNNTRRQRNITVTGPSMVLDVSGDVDEDVCAKND